MKKSYRKNTACPCIHHVLAVCSQLAKNKNKKKIKKKRKRKKTSKWPLIYDRCWLFSLLFRLEPLGANNNLAKRGQT